MNERLRRRLYAFAGLFLAAILPYLMYKIVRSLSDDKISVPAYEKPIGLDTTLDKKGKRQIDTLYHTVGDFDLINQLGKNFNFYTDTREKVVVAHLFYCDCPTCPLLTEHAENLQYSYRKRDSLLRILTITVRPEIDDVAAIRAYAQKRHANHDMWYYLTGDKEEIYRIAKNELFLDIQESNSDTGRTQHSDYFVLIDFNKHIRGYYDGLDTADLKRLKDDIALLPMEKNPKP